MDIKEIIKWFIPCFHILLAMFVKIDTKVTFIFLILFSTYPTYGANVSVSKSEIEAKNVGLIDDNSLVFNQSESLAKAVREDDIVLEDDTSVARTFGRPFMKKVVSGLIPIIFQFGAMSTWAFITAVVGVKTLFVTLMILKLLLLAGALKAGTLLGSKGHHQSHGWDPHHPQKEIHLHIHNGQHEHEVHPPVQGSTWSRNEVDLGTKSFVIDPYTGQYTAQTGPAVNPYGNYIKEFSAQAASAGPQTITTPYGNYVKIDG